MSQTDFYETKNYTTMHIQFQDIIRKKGLLRSTPTAPHPTYLPPPDFFFSSKVKKCAEKKAISYQLKHLEDRYLTVQGDKFGGISRMFSKVNTAV